MYVSVCVRYTHHDVIALIVTTFVISDTTDNISIDQLLPLMRYSFELHVKWNADTTPNY